MTSKSLTAARPHRTHVQILRDVGKHDVVDDHPLIECVPHVMGGRAHLKSSRTTVERVLKGLLQERIARDLKLETGTIVSATDVAAVIHYAIDVFINISKLYAQFGRIRKVTKETKTNGQTQSK